MGEAQLTYPFLNPELPLDERVDDLLSRLTLAEKIGLMPTAQAAVERLGIKEYAVGGEAAHGVVARIGHATLFPQPIGLGCTWDPELMRQIGACIGDEARAYYKKRKETGGLCLWAPTVDMERDPRWGRTEEAYGEDPCLTGAMATALVQGMQGDHPFYIKMSAALKHFYANNNEQNRINCSAVIDPRNKREYYLNAFRKAVTDGRVHSLMTAYNEVNGTPMIVHPDVRSVLKEEWRMDGFIVCDACDLSQTVTDHKYFATHAETVAAALKAGVDCFTDDPDLVKTAIKEALERKLITEADLDRALRNMLRIRFRFGQFDPDELNPYAQIPETILYNPEHRKLALKAAQESIVLLKNAAQTLPLSKDKLRSVAVIGPLADAVYRDWYAGTPAYRISPLQGIVEKLPGVRVDYHDACDLVAFKCAENGRYIGPGGWDNNDLVLRGEQQGSFETFAQTDWGWGSLTFKSLVNGKYMTTDDERVTVSADDIWGWYVREVFHFAPQSANGAGALTTWNGKAVALPDAEMETLRAVKQDTAENKTKFMKEMIADGAAAAAEAAKAADAAIVFVGNHPLINGKEDYDRRDIALPPAQEHLIREVYKANPRTIVVIVGSYPFALNGIEEHVPAIVYTSHGGQELGHAIADVLFGDVSPAGRLNMTWYRSLAQLPDMMDYDIIKGGRTYQYFAGNPLYPFGHGLTYAEFRYDGLAFTADRVHADGHVELRFTVENVGQMASDEVVQLYVRAEKSRVKRPLKQLQSFRRIHLAPGERMTVTFAVPASDLAFWDVTRERYCVESGLYTFMVGSSSADIRLSGSVEIIGETIPPRNLFTTTRAENYDDYQGVLLDECKAGGTCVRCRDESAEGWLLFADALLEREAKFFECGACGGLAGGMIEVLYDDPEAEPAGVWRIAAAGSRQAWSTARFPLAGATGVRNVYVRLSGDVGLSWFRLRES
ncbi:MAG TPA: glycoside hydrolase family 3 C-terminal domain-containing protein [Bacilli bacterium]